MQWLQTITNLPILVKGVITAEDSKKIHTSRPVFFLHLSGCFDLFENFQQSHNKFLQKSCCNNAARIAIQAGAAGIIVSNHGARQLDYVPATISALEEVTSDLVGILISFEPLMYM